MAAPTRATPTIAPTSRELASRVRTSGRGSRFRLRPPGTRWRVPINTNVSDTLKALDNPTRLAILGWLKNPRENFPGQEVDPEQVGVCVSAIQERVGLSQSTVSLYLASLQRARLVTSKRVGPWTYYKRHEENISTYLENLEALI